MGNGLMGLGGWGGGNGVMGLGGWGVGVGVVGWKFGDVELVGWGTRQGIPRVSLGDGRRLPGKSSVQLSFEVCDAKL